ncbi:MAG: hypothetical protein ACRDHG_15460 [Anaerolineales bacterium]
MSQQAELIHFRPTTDGWYNAQLAINGTPSVPFDIHRSQFEHMSEVQLGEMLERQASALIERYGDSRDPRPELVEVLENVA